MSRFKVLLTDYAWPDVDIERDVLARVGAELITAPRADAATLCQLAAEVDAILTCWAATTAQVLAAAPNCRIVARLGIGLDNIDVDYCTRSGIVVTNVPDYCVVEVAEHTLALVFALARGVAYHHHETKSGRYDLQSGPTPRRIEGQTIGILGLGRIGSRVAAKAQALGMRVLATTRRPRDPPPGTTLVPLERLLGESDFVSLHIPLNDQTRHVISHDQLRRMKATALLINTARGGLVDPAALAAALEQNRLAGAALDVTEPEPPDLSLPPYNDPRVLVTPHAAFVSAQSLAQLRRRAAGQVATLLSGGTPEHVVNPSVLQ